MRSFNPGNAIPRLDVEDPSSTLNTVSGQMANGKALGLHIIPRGVLLIVEIRVPMYRIFSPCLFAGRPPDSLEIISKCPPINAVLAYVDQVKSTEGI